MLKNIRYSLVIPVYRNAENLPLLFAALEKMSQSYSAGEFQVVFVVDGSPDASHDLIKDKIHSLTFKTKLLLLSRNFGAFLAMRTGLLNADGEFCAVMAADLQEPPELIHSIFDVLTKNAADLAFGQRVGRKDPFLQKILAKTYWMMYRKIVMPDIPAGGVDIFGCNQKVRDAILSIEEPNSSLMAQLFWVGFRRVFIPYSRVPRSAGESAWSLQKRIKYMLDSVFSYTDKPILAVLWIGIIGVCLSLIYAIVTLVGKLTGTITVQGYTSLILVTVIFGSTSLLTQGILGCYLWRTLENTKKRPLVIVQSLESNNGK